MKSIFCLLVILSTACGARETTTYFTNKCAYFEIWSITGYYKVISQTGDNYLVSPVTSVDTDSNTLSTGEPLEITSSTADHLKPIDCSGISNRVNTNQEGSIFNE